MAHSQIQCVAFCFYLCCCSFTFAWFQSPFLIWCGCTIICVSFFSFVGRCWLFFFVVVVLSLPLVFEKDINWLDCQSYHIFYALAYSPWSFHPQYMEHRFFCFASFCFISQCEAHTFRHGCVYVQLYYS